MPVFEKLFNASPLVTHVNVQNSETITLTMESTAKTKEVSVDQESDPANLTACHRLLISVAVYLILVKRLFVASVLHGDQVRIVKH